MSTIQEYWNILQTEYHNQPLSDEFIVKLDELILNDEIENIRNGVMLMSTLAPAVFFRYLTLCNDSIVLNDVHAWPAPLLAERALMEAIKVEQMWQSLYETGVFESMEFRTLGKVDFENLSEDQKEFCVQMSKEMAQIPAGDFMMGGLEDDEHAYRDEKPRHRVKLPREFLMGKYTVTQVLWESVMDFNPSHFKGVNLPVEQVSWLDCVAFCNKLSEQEGLEPVYTINSQEVTCNWNANGYRLPTEAEWEYSARGGDYHIYAGSDNVDEVAWYRANAENQTHPVGQKKSNGFGLYDMSGNVSEWCWDPWRDYSVEEHLNCLTDSIESTIESYSTSQCIHRGGFFFSISRFVGVSRRNAQTVTHRDCQKGFRICRFL